MPNPGGEVDRALLREGTQILFPPGEAEGLIGAVEPGAGLTIWGIRARGAPVVTMLAWAREGGQDISFVERPAWFGSAARGTNRMFVEGRIMAPLLTPNGSPMGVILEEGGVVRLAAEYHREIAARLAPGERLVAEGVGTRWRTVIALDAERLGAARNAIEPVPAQHR